MLPARYAVTMFQSTRPRGTRPRLLFLQLLFVCFNPRVRAGRDPPQWQAASSAPVSIHASARDATRKKPRSASARKFQSTRPRGTRPDSPPVFADRVGFNPRVRAGRDLEDSSKSVSVTGFNPRVRAGRDPQLYGDRRAAKFQSTRPRGTRRCRCATLAGKISFNPRVRAGRDSRPPGSDSCQQGFNPRVRAGRDHLWD